jgi:hypothetical protein
MSEKQAQQSGALKLTLFIENLTSIITFASSCKFTDAWYILVWPEEAYKAGIEHWILIFRGGTARCPLMLQAHC